MAVVITSQFYQENVWKNISKIVFTSPNIDSPAVAGTRSHILPGEGDLATWYEDTSKMYRIEDHQWETETDFFKYHMTNLSTIDLQNPPTYIDVEVATDSAFVTFINEIATNAIGYDDSTGYITDRNTKLEYTSPQKNLSEIHDNSGNMVTELIESRSLTNALDPGYTTQTRVYYTNTLVATGGFQVATIPATPLTIRFDVGESQIRYMTFESIQFTSEVWQTPVDTLFNTPIPPGTTTYTTSSGNALFIGDFTIYGTAQIYVVDGTDYTNWTELYSEQNVTDLSKIIDFGSYQEDWTVYKIVMNNNVSLDADIFDISRFGLKNLAFYKELGGNPYPYSPSYVNMYYYSDVASMLPTYMRPNSTNSIRIVKNSLSLTGQVANPAQSRTYYTYSLSRDHGWYVPVNTDTPLCHIIFEFQSAIRITQMSMSAIRVNQILWQTPQNTLFNNPMPVGTTTTTNKTYFIGNFTIHGSTDNINWVLLFTGANTTNTVKTAYFTNTQYYKYYKLSITNNTGLAIPTVGDNTYYGIGALRFYTYEFSSAAGSINVTVYDVSDPNYPKEFVINNAYPIGDSTPTESTATTIQEVTGQVVSTTVSGKINYTTNLRSNTDSYDYITNALCITTVSGVIGTDSAAQTYTKQDKMNVVVSATVAPTNYNLNDYLLFTSTGTTTVPVDTVDWFGTAGISYDTVASGTVISGVSNTNLLGTTTRRYTSSLFSKQTTNYRLVVDEYVTNSGIINAGTIFYSSGPPPTTLSGSSIGIDLSTRNSIVFELTTGEAYNCRLTAWDDVTHSTTLNELIQGDHVRCSAMAYNCEYNKIDPINVKLVASPVHNRIFKGNTVDGDNKYFYGDFDMVYRYQSTIYGDFLIFKPMLYGIDSSISYGVHDYVITFHYSYT